MTRAVAASAGVDWLKKAINLGRDNPGAVFGGAALGLVGAIVAGAGAVAVQAGLMLGLRNGAGMVLGVVFTTVLMLAVVSMLLVGFLRLIDAVENGRPARAVDVLGGLGDLRASLRVIGFTFLLTLLQYALLGLVLAVAARGVLDWYLQVAMASPETLDPSMMVLPDGLAVATLLSLVIGLVFYGVQAIGTGQIALRGRGVFGAIGDGFSGALRNLPALLVLLLVAIAAVIVAGILMIVAALLVGLLAQLVGGWLGVLVGVPLYLGFMLAMWVVAFGVAYHLWRDVCGGAAGDDSAVPAEPAAMGA